MPAVDEELLTPLDLWLATRRPRWHRDAACKEHPELDWYPRHGEPNAEQKAICRRCLVRDECLSFAVERGERNGIWGGLTASNRGKARRDVAA